MITTRLFLIIALLFSPKIPLLGQEEPIIRGKVVDLKSGNSIPFATIRLITQKGIHGVISNAEGDFQIPTTYKTIVDTIRISCIGYLNKKLLINDLTDDRINVIRLEESVRQLSEVIIKGKKEGRVTAEKIVQAAIENIPINYPVTANSYVGYYRDYQLGADQYINLNEAIVEVFDEGFSSNDQLTTALDLLDYKKNEEFKRDSTTDIAYDNAHGNKFIPGAILSPFGGNELSILRMHDAIRNSQTFSYSYINELDTDFIKNHRFKFAETVYLNKIPLYNITFHSKPEITGSKHFAKGHLYIERGNFAIHTLEYTTYENENSKTKMLYNIRVEYSRLNSLMHLNFISFNNLFKIRDPLDFKVEDILFDRDANAFVVTFNKIPEQQSALDWKNYDFSLDNEKLKIEKVEGFNERGKEKVVVVYLQRYLPFIKITELVNRMKVDVKGVKDMTGREVNVVTHISVNQFRELFVQAQTDHSKLVSDSLHILKDTPLSENKIRISSDTNTSNYWMNTPLKKE